VTPNDLVLTRQGVRFRGRLFPCTIGKGGVRVDKREGDGATPAGVHRIVGCLYRPDRMAAPVDWAVPIGPPDLWSDEVKDPDYNRLVRAPHEYGHERLRRSDPLYDLVLTTDWNWPWAVKGHGSAIFLHRWRRPGYPTEGCVAFAPEDLRWIVERIDYTSRLIVPEGLAR
jgi:L,D-peptidoglycan transpeptidase YkuD (ErfK/YbiS/YcfS/YnhG family)